MSEERQLKELDEVIADIETAKNKCMVAVGRSQQALEEIVKYLNSIGYEEVTTANLGKFKFKTAIAEHTEKKDDTVEALLKNARAALKLLDKPKDDADDQ